MKKYQFKEGVPFVSYNSNPYSKGETYAAIGKFVLFMVSVYVVLFLMLFI